MPGVWKLNNSLLSDEKFCKLIRENILEHIEFLLAFDNIQAWWEFLKTSIKEVSIGFARNKRRQLCRDRVNLTNRLIRLRQRLVDGDGSVQPLIDDTECALKSLYIREFEGVKIRSRAKWLEEGERPTRYFLNWNRPKSGKAVFMIYMMQMMLRYLLRRKLQKRMLIFILIYFLKSRLIWINKAIFCLLQPTAFLQINLCYARVRLL